MENGDCFRLKKCVYMKALARRYFKRWRTGGGCTGGKGLNLAQ
ncbi:hypothetical protein DUGA2_10400 [Duganella sp. HH101]|nr:hypothetical protein DUGA2_10400 [Duganella sp. HH101]